MPDSGLGLAGLSAWREAGGRAGCQPGPVSIARLGEQTHKLQNSCGLDCRVRNDPGRPNVYTARAKGGTEGGSWVQYWQKLNYWDGPLPQKLNYMYAARRAVRSQLGHPTSPSSGCERWVAHLEAEEVLGPDFCTDFASASRATGLGLPCHPPRSFLSGAFSGSNRNPALLGAVRVA